MSGDDLDLDAPDTEELLRDVRRPGIIAANRPMVEEMDAGIGDPMVSGTSDHPRVRAIIAELDDAGVRSRIVATLRTLADEGGEGTLRHVLLDHLALLRGERGIELARLQQHAIGVYREVRARLAARQGLPPDLDEIRQLPANRLARLLDGARAGFGDPGLRDDLVCTPAAFARARTALTRLMRPADCDPHWDDAAGQPALPREIEEPLLALAPEEREAARRLAARDRIRSSFHRAVFLVWFAADELDVAGSGFSTVLDWLLAIEETPHLFPFMQGQTPGQKAWRLARLADKLLQMHEIYARVAHYRGQGAWAGQLAGLDTRASLALLSRERAPAMPMGPELMVAVMLLPFAGLAGWVQARVADKDFVLPPDPKR
jgi:hypothetical protein